MDTRELLTRVDPSEELDRELDAVVRKSGLLLVLKRILRRYLDQEGIASATFTRDPTDRD